MKGTRWHRILRLCLALIHREIKISITPIPKAKKWIFVVGCYNSGTTLLSKMISIHPEIASLPTEGQFLTDQFFSDHEIGLPRMWVKREDLYRLTEKDNGPDPVRIKKEWAMRLNKHKSIILEKSPPNCARMRWLQKHFKDSHFIAILRNGYAVAEGISRKAEPIHSKDGWTISESAWQWRRSNEVIEEDSKYLNKFIWVKYEELTNKPNLELERIFEFLGLEDTIKIDYKNLWKIHERYETIKNMNKESFKRLTEKDVAKIKEIAGEKLDFYGYSLIQ